MPERFEVDSITLGEMLLVEEVSGKRWQALAGSQVGTLTIARFLLAWRQHENGQSPQAVWDETINLPAGSAKSDKPSSD